MAGSPMRYRIRTQIIHMAYRQTIRQLRERHKVYSEKLRKYGMKLATIDQIKDIEREDGALFDSFA